MSGRFRWRWPSHSRARRVRRGRLTRRARLVAGLVLALLAALPGESALAAVTGHVLVEEPGTTDSSSPRTVTADCPPGKQVVGAGSVKDAASGGQARPLAFHPTSSLTSVTATWREDETGFDGDWTVLTYAICANPLPGTQRVHKTSASDSNAKNVAVSCPTGKKVLGTGAATAGGSGQVVLTVVRPASDLQSVTVAAREDQTGFAGNWTVTAYAICATPPAGLERASATTPSNSQTKNAVAVCLNGKGLLGVGGETSAQTGQVGLEAFPGNLPELIHAHARGQEDEDGFAGSWTATAYAICADTATRVVNESLTDSAGKSVRADCPAGKQATGGGGDITGGDGQVVLDDLIPDGDPPTGFFTAGIEDDTGFDGDWSLRSYAICATPLPGLELESATTLSNSTSPKSINAVCPPGKQGVGTGAHINGGLGQVGLEVVSPGGTRTFASASEDEDGHGASWSLTAYAVCATPPPGFEIVSALSEPDSDHASVTATCPAGKHLLGTGVAISFGDGEVVLDDLRPNDRLRSVTVGGLEDETGFGGDWSLRASAICANH